MMKQTCEVCRREMPQGLTNDYHESFTGHKTCLENLRRQRDEALERAAELEGQNQQLEKALERIKESDVSYVGSGRRADARMQVQVIKQIAQEALKGEGDDTST